MRWMPGAISCDLPNKKDPPGHSKVPTNFHPVLFGTGPPRPPKRESFGRGYRDSWIGL
jgi:hypothetical protein